MTSQDFRCLTCCLHVTVLELLLAFIFFICFVFVSNFHRYHFEWNTEIKKNTWSFYLYIFSFPWDSGRLISALHVQNLLSENLTLLTGIKHDQQMYCITLISICERTFLHFVKSCNESSDLHLFSQDFKYFLFIIFQRKVVCLTGCLL